LQLHEWGARAAPPLVCLHGVGGHGRRFRRLAEERLAERFRVLAPDLRGHGHSGWEPPWTIAANLADVLETVSAASVERATWLGHSYGGRLILELAALEPRRVERAVLLDPAIDLLPHVGFDMAEDHRRDRVFASAEEAVQSRLDGSPTTPREFVEEEAREHLVGDRAGAFRWRYCQSAVVAAYGELCTPAPPPETLRVPTLLVHAREFGLVREDHLDAYRAALGERLEVVPVPGGHMVIWDAYEETAAAVSRFLERERDVSTHRPVGSDGRAGEARTS
jgi:lipase